MATFKQYLQNRWYRWMSFDEEVAYPYQFQFWVNVNVRNRKWGVTLSSLPEYYSLLYRGLEWLCRTLSYWNEETIALRIDNNTATWLQLDKNMNVISTNNLSWWSSILDTNNDPIDVPTPFWHYITRFRDWFFFNNAGNSKCYYEPVWWWTWLDVWALVNTLAQGWERWTIAYDFVTRCVYNYADTFFLVSLAWVLLRYQPLTNNFSDTANWKIIRYFGASKWICWLSQSGNYLKIYVTDWNITECHYAQWTFDLEESWLVQTVKYEWQLLEDCLATNWDTDYGLFYMWDWNYELREMSWYSSTLIRKTKWFYLPSLVSPYYDRSRLFFASPVEVYWQQWPTPTYVNWRRWAKARVRYRDWVLYCLMGEWIWTFTKESVWSHWWVRWWVIEWDSSLSQMDFFWNEIIWLDDLDIQIDPFVYNGCYSLYRISLDEDPEYYSTSWWIIWNVYTWGVWSLFKKNVNTTIVCWTTNTHLTVWDWDLLLSVWYRYDRESLFADDSWFHMVKQIQPTNIYDNIFITTPQVTWEAQPHPFNKPRNTIEYLVALSTDNTKISPILYEHNLIYEDSMRKYR